MGVEICNNSSQIDAYIKDIRGAANVTRFNYVFVTGEDNLFVEIEVDSDYYQRELFIYHFGELAYILFRLSKGLCYRNI